MSTDGLRILELVLQELQNKEIEREHRRNTHLMWRPQTSAHSITLQRFQLHPQALECYRLTEVLYSIFYSKCSKVKIDIARSIGLWTLGHRCLLVTALPVTIILQDCNLNTSLPILLMLQWSRLILHKTWAEIQCFPKRYVEMVDFLQNFS